MKVRRINVAVLLRFAALCCWVLATAADAEYLIYKDPKQPLNSRIRDLMNRMTLEEKIGQMAQVEREVTTFDVMKNYYIGSVLSGGGSTPGPKATPEMWVDMVKGFQDGALATRLGIPMIYGIDAVHGNNNAFNATVFPHNVGLGVTRDPLLVKRIGTATALEVRATGVNYAFSPCIAVCRDPRWGRCYESYSEDFRIVRSMTEIIPGLQGDVPPNYRKGVPYVAKDRVIGCAKHFVGDGVTQIGTDEGNTLISAHEMFSVHMPAYYDSIIKGVATIMVSYSSWNGVKMHTNRNLVTGFLKNTLKFRGFLISDWFAVDRITVPIHSNYTGSLASTINAGLDMVMIPYNYTEFFNDMRFLVKNNYVSMSRIDDAVKRILRVKFGMGLFENPLPDLTYAKYLGCKEHRELAREAVRKSQVLLKNGKFGEPPMIPLPKKASKILVAGTHADNIGYQCGGWTIEWEGLSGNITAGTSILTAIRNTVDPATKVVYEENPSLSYMMSNNDFDYAIVAVGEYPYAEYYGDNHNLTIPDPGLDAVLNVCQTVKCVVVIISGRPVVIEPYIESMHAVVAAWLPGSEGQGIADVLFGDYGFTGKLARTWFKSVDQLPMNFGDINYNPLFPLGFGLTTSGAK